MQFTTSTKTPPTGTTTRNTTADVQAAKKQRVEPQPQGDTGAAQLLSVLMCNDSVWPIVGLLRSGDLHIEPGPPRLQWNPFLNDPAIARQQRLVLQLLQGMTHHFPGLVLDALPDLAGSTYRTLNRNNQPAKDFETQIAALLDLWCTGKVTGELRSARKWIGILLEAPWRQVPGRYKTFAMRRGYLRHLHAGSRAQGDPEMAQWAWDEACKIDLTETEAQTWAGAASTQAVAAQPAPSSDPLQSALARLKPASGEEAALYASGLNAAEQMAHLLGCCSFADRLTPDILRLLGHGGVLLEPRLPVSPGSLVNQTCWRVTSPPQPALIVALANLLWGTYPALASKVVELLLAAWQACPGGEDRAYLRNALIYTALGQHRDHPAILQFPSWILVLSEALAGDTASGQARIEAEQVLLAWLQPWSSAPVDMHLAAAALRHALANAGQSQQSQHCLVACVECLHTAACRDPAHRRWTEWALLALYQMAVPAARAALQRCLAAAGQSAHCAALATQLERDGWKNPQAILPSQGDADRGAQLFSLLRLAPPPARTAALLRMAKRHGMLAPAAAGIVPPGEFLPFAQHLLSEACLLQEALTPRPAEIDLLLSTCFDYLMRCHELGRTAPGSAQLLQAIASSLADLLARRSTNAAPLTANGQRVCGEILLRYVEGELRLEHPQVLCFLGQLPLASSSGALKWVSMKQAWQVLQALEQQLLSQPNGHPGDALNKVAEYAEKLFREASFDPPRQRALLAHQQLESRGWPTDLQLLVDVYRGPWGAQRAPIIQRLQSYSGESPAPKLSSDEMAALIRAQAAAAQILAEAAALMAWGMGALPGELLDVAKVCLRLLEAEPVKLPDVSELACAVAAVLASPLELGDARKPWEQLRELLLRRWRPGGYAIAGHVLLDVVWPHLETGGPDPEVAQDLVRVYAWHDDGALRQRVINILRAYPDNPGVKAALDECQKHQVELKLHDALRLAYQKLADAKLEIVLRDGDDIGLGGSVEWNSLQLVGDYVPEQHRALLEQIAQLTPLEDAETYVRILWYLCDKHGDLQAEHEAARNEWPVYRFTYNSQVTVTIDGTPAQKWIGYMLMQDLMHEAFPGKPFHLANNELTVDPRDVDVRSLRARLYDPEARIRAAAALVPMVVAVQKNKGWDPNVSYWPVAECLLGCLLGGRQAEASEAWEVLWNGYRTTPKIWEAEANPLPSALTMYTFLTHMPRAQGMSVLRARCMILRSRHPLFYASEFQSAFEAIAKELDWRDPDLGAEERWHWALHWSSHDRSTALQVCRPALPLSLERSEEYVSAAVQLDPQQSFLADLRSLTLAEMNRMVAAQPISEGCSVSSWAWGRFAYDPPEGLKSEELASLQKAVEMISNMMRWDGKSEPNKLRDWCLQLAKYKCIPVLATLFPRMNHLDKEAAWTAVSGVIRQLAAASPPDPMAACELLDAVPVDARNTDWYALNVRLGHKPVPPAIATASPVPQQRLEASLQRWLASPPSMGGVKLSKKTLQAVMTLCLTLGIDAGAGADAVLALLLKADDGADALAAIESGRLAVTLSPASDITGRIRWTIGPNVRAFESLGQLALLLLQRADPAGIGLLHRLICSDMSPARRGELLRKVLRLWGHMASHDVRACSHSGWANFFALALRQPDFPADIATALKETRLKILQRWQEGAYTIAAPVVLALLDSRVLKSDVDNDEALFLRRLYEQADSAPVRRWVRQRAMWLGIAHNILPPAQDDPSSGVHQEILRWLLAQRGIDLSRRQHGASHWGDVQLVAALAVHLDAPQGASLLLDYEAWQRSFVGAQRLFWPFAEVALKLPSSSTALRDRLISAWCTLASNPGSEEIEAIARTATALNRLLIAEGCHEDSATLKSSMNVTLKTRVLDWDTGELRP
ncbi:hypothetical protein GCM10023165_18810 [Variovorax defluvii]|uniref:Uncharacterized protein n=1 Tax=Variovorax defluvii TaxID=913761 RepID=A0ABP8HHG9_9BURK